MYSDIGDVMEEKYLVLDDGKKLFYRVWRVEGCVATIHINHGMAEHSLRYDEFAKRMNKEGFTVYAQDHRGHGKSADGLYGYFSERDGWSRIANDSYQLDKEIEKEYPDLPHFIFGHSMGSFLTRTNIALHSDDYSAAVICGTGGSQGFLGKVGLFIANAHVRRNGGKQKDALLDKLAFGSFNKKFKEEGEFAWLSSDRKEVEKYIADPECGFICTSAFYRDLITGSFTANDKKLASAIRKDLPIMLISGDMDPVGGYSKGVKESYERYKSVGIEDVRLVLMEGGRHEILNDKMRYDVMDHIVSFYKGVLNEK